MPATTHWVSDEVWNALDPNVGRLTRRGRLALAAGALAVALVIAAAVAVQVSGVLRPHVHGWAPEIALEEHDHAAVVHLRVGNNDWLTERVTGVTTGTRGVTITNWSRTSVPAHDERLMIIRMTFDCATAAQGPVTLTLRLHRPWGSARVTVWGPDLPGSGADRLAVNVSTNGPGWTACGRGLGG